MASILLYDSGAGGLNMLLRLREIYPDHEYTLVADNAGFPYGDMDVSTLRARVARTLAQVGGSYDAAVIACNTVSLLASEHFYEISQRVIRVAPEFAEAMMTSSQDRIAVLATPNAVKSDYVKRVLEDNPAISIVPTVSLVLASEYEALGKPVQTSYLRDIIAPVIDDENIETVILGCTHFPWVAERMARLAPHVRNWIDSVSSTAAMLVDLEHSGASVVNIILTGEPSPEAIHLYFGNVVKANNLRVLSRENTP